MQLNGTPFNTVWGASGVQGFFGEGYWFHDYLKHYGLNFAKATFVAKTTTLLPRLGNMPLSSSCRPKERIPKCIVVKPIKGCALNAVGLSGPGAYELFNTHLWQKRREPFFISFMSVAHRPEERLSELKQFVNLFEWHLPRFNAPVGLQINYSCPNVGVNSSELLEEIGEGLSCAAALGVPLVPKLNLLVPVAVAKEICENRFCDALCISNTIPWGALPQRINWEQLFATPTSPLAHLGGGGLSGKPLLPLLIEWLRSAREEGITKPINAGGGILSLGDARAVLRAGATSISLGSIAFLRPWRVRGIICGLQPRPHM